MLTFINKMCFFKNIKLLSSAVINIRLSSSLPSVLNEDAAYYSVLNPFIDFDHRLKSVKLKNSLAKRNININLDKLSSIWSQYETGKKIKLDLEKTKTEIAEQIKSYSADSKKYQTEIAGLKVAGKVVRHDLKNVSTAITDLEKVLLNKVITLPNDLREDLFSDEPQLHLLPTKSSEHHLKIGEKLSLIDFSCPAIYFLKNEAVEFELKVPSYVAKVFCRNGFIPSSNPDFSRTLLMEGMCMNTTSVIKLERDKRSDDLFLNGSASLFPFFSYLAKHVSNRIPVKIVTQGRQYTKNSFEDGLYSVWQNSAVQIFIASSKSEIKQDFESTLKIITDIYTQFGLHFRILRLPPSQLQLSEALRLSIQIHSPFKNDFFEVGNLSFYEDYISKRLRIYYKDGSDKQFLHMISGTILKVPPLLASYLEHNDHCKLPITSFA